MKPVKQANVGLDATRLGRLSSAIEDDIAAENTLGPSSHLPEKGGLGFYRDM